MKVKMEIVLSFLAALLAMYLFPTGYLMLTAVLSIVAYCVTESVDAVLGVLVIMIFLRVLSTTLEPSGNYGAATGPVGGRVQAAMENFQPRDPVSIHQRISETKKVEPAVNKIFGVLESPNILNSLEIAQIPDSEKASTRSTVPAAPGAYEMIRTPTEGFMPNIPSPDSAPRAAMYLQNGPDDGAVDTALSKKGSNMRGDSGDLPGIPVGPAAVGANVDSN